MEIVMADLMRWCKVSMTDDQIRIMHQKLKDLNSAALEHACNRFMDDRKQSKSAFPTIREILNVAAEYYSQHPDQLDVDYDYYDDNRFPYQWLLQAYRILRDVGVKSFTVFCKSMKMPLHDQERCLNKARVAGDAKDVDDIIINLMMERNRGKRREQDHQSHQGLS